jgi:hypothetical protein
VSKIHIVSRRSEVSGGQVIASSNPSTGFVVFYRPNAIDRGGDVVGINPGNLAFQFHEALHGFGNANNLLGTSQNPGPLTDEGLQDLFGLTKGAGSKNISDYIKKNCFK